MGIGQSSRRWTRYPSTTTGRSEFANLPRKLNVCMSSTRDDFHTHFNDVGFEAVRNPASGAVMFNAW